MLHPFFDNDEELYPELSDKDKLKSLINILRGHEEFILDTTGIIISSNLESVTITGYEEWEVIGKSLSLFYSQEDIQRHRLEHDLYKTSKQQKFSTTDLKVKKQGDKFLATTKFEVICNKGELNGFRVILHDATHSAIHDISTKKIKDENSYIYKNPFVGIFRALITDLSFARLNVKAIEIFGLDSNFNRLSDIFYHVEEFIRFKETLFKDGHIENFVLRVTNEKTEVYCLVSATLHRNEGFIEGVIKDITESRKQAIEIQKVKAELDNFLYRSSHDIRAPLATILGLVNLIKFDQPNSIEGVLEYVKLIEERAIHLDFVLKELSDVSYNNQHDLRIEKINAEVVLNRIIEPLRDKFPFIHVSTTFATSNAEFFNDLSRVQIILGNVIYNSFLFHNTNQTKPYVKILFNQIDSKVVFEIEDNGIGINETHMANIYDIFFKINMDRGGAGLGLFVTKSMIDKLNGSIQIKSQIGQGTSVSIVLNNEINFINRSRL